MVDPKKEKQRAGRNRTITLNKEDIPALRANLLTLNTRVNPEEITNRTIHQDLFECIEYLPEGFVDLLFIDPPYNLTKEFNSNKFREMPSDEYEEWVDSWLKPLRRLLKQTGAIYICGDWKSSSAVFRVMSRYFKVRNRITWEREKGRGAKANWKNCSEDIWFGTVSNDFTFDSDAVIAISDRNDTYSVNRSPPSQPSPIKGEGVQEFLDESHF